MQKRNGLIFSGAFSITSSGCSNNRNHKQIDLGEKLHHNL